MANVENKFRDRLIDTYLVAKRDCTEAKYESAGIKCGKFCEILVRLLQKEITNIYIGFNKRIPNMADECSKLIAAENINNVSESMKNIIPRALVFLYTMRNKRGIGHVGGDIDANEIDIATMMRVMDWILCELVRIYHKLSLKKAQDLIDTISVKSLPIIWEVAGKKRVMKDGLNAKQKVLLLLYFELDVAVSAGDLCKWVKYSSPSMFVKRVLIGLDQKMFIDYDSEQKLVYLSPKGIKEVEGKLL